MEQRRWALGSNSGTSKSVWQFNIYNRRESLSEISWLQNLAVIVIYPIFANLVFQMWNFSREILQIGSFDPSEPNFGHQKAPNQPKSAKIHLEVAKSNPHYYRELFIQICDFVWSSDVVACAS